MDECPWEIEKDVLGSQCAIFLLGHVRGRRWGAGMLLGGGRSSAGARGTGGSTVEGGCSSSASPELRTPSQQPIAATASWISHTCVIGAVGSAVIISCDGSFPWR